jgi:hypothetical protein
MTYEEFQQILHEELLRIPYQYKRGVNGFYAEKRPHRHEKLSLGLYTLGHYMPSADPGGARIVLYYGSFRKVFRGAPAPLLRQEIAKTLAHELLHHWEHQAGVNPLGEEDARKLARWKQRLGLPTGAPTGRDLREALVFLVLVFGSIFGASVWYYHF